MRALQPPLRVLALAALLFLALQAMTGTALFLVYEFSPTSAHASVERVASSPVAWVRGLHAWTADAMLVFFLAAGAHVFVQRASMLTPSLWMAGLVMLGSLLMAFATGGVLTWDQQAWESYQHGLAALGRSAEDPDATPLAAILAVHLLAAAAFAAPALWFFARGRIQGLGPEWMAALRRSAFVGAPILLVLALVLPPRLGPAPIAGLSVSKPDWPFLWLVPVQDRLGPLGVWAFPALLAALASLAWMPSQRPRFRAGILSLVLLVVGSLTLGGLLW